MYKIQEFSESKFNIPFEQTPILEKINDSDFLNYLDEINGGFYYSGALHIYGSCSEPEYHSIDYMNNIISSSFKDLSTGLIFFGCDLFGNQFAFSDKGIIHFHIETGEREIIAKDFSDWVNVVMADCDYFSGESLLIKWKKLYNERLLHNSYLLPKKLFITGGEYDPINLYSNNFEKSVNFYADIAHQIKDLPAGSKVKFTII